MSFSMCRVCLVGDGRMLDIDNVHLIEMYEKLTNTTLSAEADSRMPSKLCYVCHRQLQKCHRFSNMAQKSNIILRQLLDDSVEESHTTFILPSQEIMHHLVVSLTQHTSINIETSISPTIVKEEITAVKVEQAIEDIGEEALDEDVEQSNDSNDIEPSKENDIVKNSSTSLCFTCNFCYKKMTNKYLLVEHLKAHMGDHTKEKPYRCNRCDKVFTRKYDLTRHIRIHTGEKPYPCGRCNKTYSHKGQLTSHMLIHTGEKPYSCSMCDKTFTQKGSVGSHMLIHTGKGHIPAACVIKHLL